MNYQETIDFLYTQLPMFSKTGSDAIKKGLDNIIQLCNNIDNPQQKFKCIHIAGTNGKGSVSHMIAAILQTAGYKTGLYTSPHLIDFRERIKINGEMISPANVVDFVSRIAPEIQQIHPSFFEITVAMAFDYFAAENVDYAIIETGLGGRLDSTNIIHPILSVITNIAYDHTDLLGNTLELIASEKAGIIKQYTPVVIGEVIPETKDVFIQKAAVEAAALVFAQHHWTYISHYANNDILDIALSNNSNDEVCNYHLDLRGSYQVHNLITVLSVVDQLNILGLAINRTHISYALFNASKITGLRGRWDVIQQKPMIVIDVGHNAHGINEVIKQIEKINYHQLHIITGMVKDKDVNSVLQLLPTYALYYFSKAQIPRALDENMLLEKATEYNLKGKSFKTVKQAILSAIENTNENDLIVICGSVFVAGEAYQHFLTNKQA